jgi:uncharacterized membrane protein
LLSEITMPMTRWLAAYAATAFVMVAIDLVWLGYIARPLYQQGIGHLMAPQPNWVAAGVFYALFPVGLVVFAVMPEGSYGRTALLAALFGLLAYATYDLTNLATLRGWPLGLSLLDMTWGSAVSAVAAVAGKWVLSRVA